MSGYIGTQPVPQATQTRDAFTATAGQTSFATGGYTPQFLDVYLNGVHLQNGTDYTAANGSDVVLTVGAALDDVLEVVAYSTFDSANTYNRTEADAEFVNDPDDVITVSGSNVGIGTTTLNSNKAVIEGGSTGAHSSSLKLSTGPSASGLASDLAFYGTFVTPTSDRGPRRTADITSGFSTGSWDNEYLAFGVGNGGDAANLTTERMRISGSGNVGIGTSSPDSTPSTKLHIREDDSTDYRARAVVQASDQRLVLGSHWQAGVAQYSYVQATNDAETAAQTLSLNPDGGAVTMPYQPLANVMIFDHNTSGVHAGAGVSALNYSQAMSQGGMSVTSDRITVPVAGKYYVSTRQLNLSNTGEYFNILLNGTSIGYAYNSNTSHLHDLNVDMIVSMSANDYIQVYYNTATANRFEGGHSNLLIHLIG